MANYLVASGSRKLSQLEIATNPVPAGSSSIMPLVIGDAIPITNGTTVQITPDNFLSNLVFDAAETYTNNNTFSGANTFSGTNTFSAINTFTANNIFSGVNNFSGSSTVFNIASSSVSYQTAIQGGEIELFDGTVGDTLRIKIYSGDGIKFEDFGGSTYGTFMEVGTQKGEITLKRNTTIEGNLTVNEVFYVYETASILNSSGSTQFGDSIDDTHLFTGSIKITGSLNIVDGGLIDGVDVSVFKSDYDTASGSFSTRVTQNEGDISLLSGSYETFSGSQYQTDSASFSSDITENSQSLSLLSASFETTSSKLIDASGSFSTRVTNNELTGSDHEDRIVKGTNAVTSSAISSSYIDLDVLSNGDIPAHKAGRIFFGQEDGALEVYNEEADFTLQVGQEFVVRAYNKSGAVIENGTPVYASGSQGDRIGIYPATAEDHTSGVHYDNHIIGIATHEIGISEEGYVTAQGIVRGVDTSGFTAGDTLYLQTGSPATVTDYFRNDPPPFPYDIVQVGYVSRAQNNGFIFVEPKEPVHFNNISGLSGSVNPEVGDLWVYQSNNGWSTTHTLSGSYNLEGDIIGGEFSGSFSGSFEGDGSQLTGITSYTDADTLAFIDSKGVISGSSQVDLSQATGTAANATNATNATNADNIALTADGTNTNRYVPFTATATGDGTLLTDPGILYNPSTNVLTATTFNGDLSGNATTATSANSVEYSNVANKPTLVSGSSQVVFNDTSFNPFISTSAAISASNHFVPSDNEVYDLGTPTQRWRDLYLSGSTIDLGGLLIQKNADGNLQLIDSASQATKSVEGIVSPIFLQTGSYYSTANDLQITGSVVVSTDVTASGLLINETASINYALVNDTLQGNGSGFQFFAYNEDTVKVKFANWYSSNDRQYGMGQLWFETWFAAIDNNADPALRDERRIGFYLEEPNAGASDAVGGSAAHPSNARFYVDVDGAYLSGSLDTTGDVTASGAISASGELVGTSLNLRTYNHPGGGRVKNYSNTTNYYNALTGSSGGIVLGNGSLYPNAVYLFTIGNENVFADSDVGYFRASTTLFTGPESGSVWGTFVDVPTTTGGPRDTTVGVTPHNGTGVRVKITNGPDFDAGSETVSLRITATMLSEIDM